MKRELAFILIILISINLLNAFPTNITIKTKSKALVDIRALNPQTGKTLEGNLFSEVSDDSGRINIFYTSRPEDPRRLKIYISTVEKDNGNRMSLFKDVETGGEILIDLTGSTAKLIPIAKVEETTPVNSSSNNSSVNESQIEKNNTEENISMDTEEVLQELQETGITGKAAVNKEGGDMPAISKIVYYVIGFFAVVGFLALLISMILRKRTTSASIVKYRDKKDLISDAEKKIHEIEEDLKEIKKEEKIPSFAHNPYSRR